jgi:hypothetical protein
MASSVMRTRSRVRRGLARRGPAMAAPTTTTAEEDELELAILEEEQHLGITLLPHVMQTAPFWRHPANAPNPDLTIDLENAGTSSEEEEEDDDASESSSLNGFIVSDNAPIALEGEATVDEEEYDDDTDDDIMSSSSEAGSWTEASEDVEAWSDAESGPVTDDSVA